MPQIPFSFQWSISENELLQLKDSVEECLRSNAIQNIPSFEYFLSCYPNGFKNHKGKTWIFLQLKFKSGVQKVEADYTLTIESANNSSYDMHLLFEKSDGLGCRICTTEELFDSEKNFIVDGKLIVKVNGIFKFEDVNAPAPKLQQQQKWEGGELGDELWKKNDTKDFTIATADGKEIEVHKFILANRSEVFTAMLNSNMQETRENKIVMTDFSFNVVEAALKVIYNCNLISSLSIDEMISLLQFFDKYNLVTLKDKVELLLINRISSLTVCSLTNGSILTNSSKLKNKCIEFLMACIGSKTSVKDIETLDKDIALKVLQNSLCHIVETKKK